MNKQFFGNYQAKIISYNDKARTAQVSIPTVTGDLEEGITATFAYPVSHDDRDTELEILDGADCYVFFEQGDPYSPVIFAYKSHGIGAVIDHRRIRQENIELLARKNILFTADTVQVKAEDSITVVASTVNVSSASNITVTSDTKVTISAPMVSINGL